MTQPDKDSVERLAARLDDQQTKWMTPLLGEAAQMLRDLHIQSIIDGALLDGTLQRVTALQARVEALETALAASGAAAAEIRDNAATSVRMHVGNKVASFIEAIPLPTNAQAALDRVLDGVIETAAKWAEQGFYCRSCNVEFLDDQGHFDEECSAGRASWVGLPSERLPSVIRALKRQPGKGE